MACLKAHPLEAAVALDPLEDWSLDQVHAQLGNLPKQLIVREPSQSGVAYASVHEVTLILPSLKKVTGERLEGLLAEGFAMLRMGGVFQIVSLSPGEDAALYHVHDACMTWLEHPGVVPVHRAVPLRSAKPDFPQLSYLSLLEATGR